MVKIKIGNITDTIFIAINIIVIVAMNFCAYTAYLHPTYHPNFSYFGLAFPVFLAANVLFFFFWLLRKNWLVFLPLVGMLACACSVRTFFPINYRPEAPEGSIKFMSYNVANFGGPPMAKVDYDQNPVVRYMLDSDADIICIQEGNVAGSSKVAEVLSKTYPYIMTGSQDGCHFNACISKYPVLSSEQIHYESKTNRSYAYKLLIDDDTVLVVNNHFESYQLHTEDRDDYKKIIMHPKNDSTILRFDSLTHKLIAKNRIRGLQADRVAEYIDSVKCKYKIACGDFNDPSLSYTHHRMTRTMNDAFTQSGFGIGYSFNRSGMYFRIDNILVNDNIATYKTKVDNSISESDHYPIISYLFFKGKMKKNM